MQDHWRIFKVEFNPIELSKDVDNSLEKQYENTGLDTP